MTCVRGYYRDLDLTFNQTSLKSVERPENNPVNVQFMPENMFHYCNCGISDWGGGTHNMMCLQRKGILKNGVVDEVKVLSRVNLVGQHFAQVDGEA